MIITGTKSTTLFMLLLFLSILAFAFSYNMFFSVTDENEVWVVVFVCVSTAALMIYLLSTAPLYPNFCIAAGLLIRVVWLFVHKELWVVSDTLGLFYNLDAYAYHKHAILYVNNAIVSRTEDYGIYPRILKDVYLATGENRLIGGWLNVLLGILTAILIVKILGLLKTNEKAQALGASIYLFLPISIMHGVSTFREQFIILLFVASIYFFFLWFYGRNCFYALAALLSLLMSSSFHSGVSPALAVYVFFFIFFDRKKQKYRFSFLVFIGFVSFVLIFALIPRDQILKLFFDKFIRYSSVDSLLDWLSQAFGDSAYLEWIDLQSAWDLSWFIPIKFFYFWWSPVPWEWRGLQDAAAFIADSLIYIVLLAKGFWRPGKKGVFSVEWSILALLTLIVGATYAGGTFSAGTALRHRLKLLPLLSIFAIYSTPGFRADALTLLLPNKFKKLYSKLANTVLRRG